MKTFCILFFLLINSAAFGQNSGAADSIQVQNLIIHSFDELFSKLDSKRLHEFYTDDFLLLEQGEVWDNKIIAEYFDRAILSPNSPIRTNRFEFIKTKVEGNRAWVAYWNYATFTKDGQIVRDIKWLESATAIKTDQGWRLDMLHSTRVEKP
ncbi:MAG TPA: nuclear transport factor 2 family protein [Algoriphagus sp.]|nr:nuclear transport factor 2 family protein [Algoriphagus sp.]